MPNWCSNTLEVRGDIEQLKEFVEKSVVKEGIREPDFTMEGLLPTPKELTEVTSPVIWRGDENDTEGKAAFEADNKRRLETYGATDWYDWNVSNWGTKWDVGESHISYDDEDLFIVSYDTAWSPNITFVQKVSKMFPGLEFRLTYMEPGCNFCGVAHCVDGELEVEEGDIVLADSNGREVEYDSDLDRYKYIDDGEVIDDEDFYPEYINQYDY